MCPRWAPRLPQRHLVVNTRITAWDDDEAEAISDVVFLLKLQSYWQPVMSGLILMLVVVLTSLIEVRSPQGGGG